MNQFIEEKIMDARIELPKFMSMESDWEHGPTAVFNIKGAADWLRQAFTDVANAQKEIDIKILEEIRAVFLSQEEILTKSNKHKIRNSALNDAITKIREV